MRIRIIKSPPAPLMDGFDVRNMVADQICDVDSRTANYLVIAGYGVRIRANDDYPHDRNRRVSRNQQNDNPPPEAELSGPSLGAGKEQSRPEEATDERQKAEPMEE
jgi:hypothetical protein